MKKIVLTAILVAMGVTRSNAAILNVPGQYPNIQAAINTAKAGDHIVLADGDYAGLGNINLDFLGKTITLESQNGAAKAVIDCHVAPDSSEKHNRGIYIHNGEKRAVIKGITVTGEDEGDHAFGDAGIFVERGDVVITDCILKDNRGSGLLVGQNTTASVTNCTFTENGDSPSYPTSAATVDGDTHFSKCVFTANHGRGMTIRSGKSSVTKCVFRGNEGGGLSIVQISPAITDCVFISNSGVYPPNKAPGVVNYGGGISVAGAGASPEIVSCFFLGNTAVAGGGMCANVASSPRIKNCFFLNNIAQDPNNSGYTVCGGAIYAFESSPVFTNCTITGNVAPLGYGGGVTMDSAQSPVFLNCILYGDKGGEIHLGSLTSNVVTYCDVEGTFAGEGNIDTNPRFIDQTKGDLGLQHNSPCLGAGNHVGSPPTDFVGKSRPIHPSMGAFEEGPVFN